MRKKHSKHTQGILDAGWNDDIELMIIHRKPKTSLTNEEAEILQPIFRNLIDMIWNSGEIYTNGISDVDSREIREECTTHVLCRVLPSFTMKRNTGAKVVNYFVLCIKRYLFWKVRTRWKADNTMISLNLLSEARDESGINEEPMLKVHPCYTDNQHQSEDHCSRTATNKKLLPELLTFFHEYFRYRQGYKRRCVVIQAITHLYETPDNIEKSILKSIVNQANHIDPTARITEYYLHSFLCSLIVAFARHKTGRHITGGKMEKRKYAKRLLQEMTHGYE